MASTLARSPSARRRSSRASPRARRRRRTACSVPPAVRERGLRAARCAPREASPGSRPSPGPGPRRVAAGTRLLRRPLGLDVAAEREDQGLSVPRATSVRRRCRRTRPEPQGTLGNPQRFDEILAARLAERDIEPEEAPFSAQSSDTLSLGDAESGEYLRHPPDYGCRRTLTPEARSRTTAEANTVGGPASRSQSAWLGRYYAARRAAPAAFRRRALPGSNVRGGTTGLRERTVARASPVTFLAETVSRLPKSAPALRKRGSFTHASRALARSGAHLRFAALFECLPAMRTGAPCTPTAAVRTQP